MMLKNKKGIFFTLLVIAILFLFTISYTLYSDIKSREAVTKRVETMNNFVFSFEKDLERQLYISGFRIIVIFEKRIIDTGSYINNFDSTFNEVFFNGTIYGETFQEIEELMNGANFSDIQNLLSARANEINADGSLINPVLTVTQDDPWSVKVNLTAELTIHDKTNLALWNKTLTTLSYISIENFEDPLYVLKTNGKVINKINKTIYENFVSGSDVTNLTLHLENSYYTASSLAPSFLYRLQGNMSASENGIESLVYLPKLSAQGIAVKDKTDVDYIYFSSDTPTSHHISGMPSWFRIDDAHLSLYQVSNLTID